MMSEDRYILSSFLFVFSEAASLGLLNTTILSFVVRETIDFLAS